jgi:hypothetical protein
MIKLIVTADDELYDRLSTKAGESGDTFRRARNVVDAYRQAASGSIDTVVVDLSVHAADTLVETLHSRPTTSHIPLYVVECASERLPFALRRLCTDILASDAL